MPCGCTVSRRNLTEDTHTARDSRPSAHFVPLTQFAQLLEPHERVAPASLWRETSWAHHKPRLEGTSQRDGTLIADAVVVVKEQHVQ